MTALRTEPAPLTRDLVATFHVTRGVFIMPAELLAEDADPWEVARFFAIHLPDRAPGTTVTTTRQVRADGSARIAWRRVLVRVRAA